MAGPGGMSPSGMSGARGGGQALLSWRVAILPFLGEDELYVVIPGHALARVADEAVTIASANSRLADYHQGRRKELSRPALSGS